MPFQTTDDCDDRQFAFLLDNSPRPRRHVNDMVDRAEDTALEIEHIVETLIVRQLAACRDIRSLR